MLSEVGFVYGSVILKFVHCGFVPNDLDLSLGSRMYHLCNPLSLRRILLINVSLFMRM